MGGGGVNILQYADDTIFVIQDDVASARNLKLCYVLLSKCQD